jgi:hypothetical protein
VCGRDVQWLLQHAKSARMREGEATGGGDGFREGFCDAHDETATVEGAAGGSRAARAEGSECMG